MKFETKIGIGEVVAIEAVRSPKSYPQNVPDFLAEVVAITFDRNMKPAYLCEIHTTKGVERLYYAEDQLIGDPDFCQEAGKYPDDVDA